MPDGKEEVLGDLAGFDQQWDDTDAAEDVQGKTVPPATYHCAVQDYTWIKSTEKKTRGLKLTFEIIDPETVEVTETVKGKPVKKQVTTRGKTIAHVFWISPGALPYVKRDVRKLIGRELTSIKELVDVNWMECFAEIVSKNERNPNGWMESRVAFLNEWSPEKERSAKEKKKEKKKEAAAPVAGDEDIPF